MWWGMCAAAQTTMLWRYFVVFRSFMFMFLIPHMGILWLLGYDTVDEMTSTLVEQRDVVGLFSEQRHTVSWLRFEPQNNTERLKRWMKMWTGRGSVLRWKIVTRKGDRCVTRKSSWGLFELVLSWIQLHLSPQRRQISKSLINESLSYE